MELTEKTKQNYTGIGIYKDGDRNYVGDHVGGREHGIGVYECRVTYDTKKKIYRPVHRYAGQFDDNKTEGIGIKTYYDEKPFLGIFMKIYFLPVNLLEKFNKLRAKHAYNKCLYEIRVIKNLLKQKQEG